MPATGHTTRKHYLPGGNMQKIRCDLPGMLQRALLISAAAVVVLVSGCGSNDPDVTTPQSTASSTIVRDFGDEISEVSDTIAAVINAGCGGAPKPTCEASGEQVTGLARNLRKLIVESGRSEFYSEALRIIDRISSASSSLELRGAAIDLVNWIDENPT